MPASRVWQQLAIALNWPVLVAVTVLTSAGILSIWVASPVDGPKQLRYVGVAIACLIAVQSLNYSEIGRYSWSFYVGSFLLVAYTVVGTRIPVPGVNRVKGACAWINLGGISFEPSELMKVSFVMVLARYLRFRSNYRTLRGLVPPFLLALAPMALILKQPDLGVATLFIPTLLAMLFVAGARRAHLFAVIAVGLLLVPLVLLSGNPNVRFFRHLPALLHDYQRLRVEAMFTTDPRTLREAGFQQHQAEVAMGSGGLTGKGLGNIPVGRKVPEAHNDMIYAIIGEQFGFVGSIVMLVAYVVLFAAGVEIAAATKEPFGRLMAVGIVSLLAAQTFLNLMVVTRMFPVTGVTLPFVSAGGTSLVASFIAAGLLLNIGQNRPLMIGRPSFEYD